MMLIAFKTCKQNFSVFIAAKNYVELCKEELFGGGRCVHKCVYRVGCFDGELCVLDSERKAI